MEAYHLFLLKLQRAMTITGYFHLELFTNSLRYSYFRLMKILNERYKIVKFVSV